MNVVHFPPVEPWPTELFEQYGITELEALIDGAHAEIVKRRSAALDASVDSCSDCGELLHPAESICGACAAPHVPQKTTGPARDSLDERSEQGQEVTTVVETHGCTCGGRGLCVRCVLQSYEPDIDHVSSAHNSLEAALVRRPADLKAVSDGR